MSSDNTANGAVLGAATTAGVLTPFINDWRIAALIAAAILIAGVFIIFLKKRKKKED